MINGHMAEAQKGFAIIEDVGDDTFVRFIQWAYNGYYDAAKYELVNPPSMTSGWRGFGTSKKSRKGKKVVPRTQVFWTHDESPIGSSKEQLEESFIKRKETVRKNLMSIPPRRNCKPNEDYSEVFLCHARLYVFAEKYDIQPLKDLALEELQATLAIFTLYQERTGDVISLLRYVYANTREPVKGVEDMRALLTHYVGCKMDTLMKDDNFRELMIEDGGALLGDFMKMVGKRIC